MKTELPEGELEKITFCWISQLDMKMRNLFAVVLKLKQGFFDVGHWCCCERLQNLSVNWVCCVYKHLPDLILNGWSKMDFWSPVKWGKMSETTEIGRGNLQPSKAEISAPRWKIYIFSSFCVSFWWAGFHVKKNL